MQIGYIRRSNSSLLLKLSVKDEYMVDKFINTIGGELNLKMYYGPYKTCGKSVEITVLDKVFVSNLINLGCVTKKSKIIRFPKLHNEDFRLSFLLGFFDGDGSEGSTSLTCGSLEFLNDICELYNTPSKPKFKSESTWTLTLGAKLFKKMLLCYPNSMPRKRKTHRTGKML